MVYCAGKLIENLKIKAIDHTFYGFTSVITHLGCWENTQKACKSPTLGSDMIYKLFLCSPNIPRGLSRR